MYVTSEASRGNRCGALPLGLLPRRGLRRWSLPRREWSRVPGPVALWVTALLVGIAGSAGAQPPESPGPLVPPGREDILLVIRGDAVLKVPVLVRDFTYDGAPRKLLRTGEEPEQIVVQDLTFSDFFDVRREGVAPARGGESPDAVVWGRVTERFGKVVLNGQIIDPETGDLIFQKDYALSDPPDRWVLHAFSDDIVLYLTGEAGVASTRIAFVGDATGSKELYVVDYDGARLTRVTSLNSISVSPSWSPDGTELAFTTFARGKPDLMRAKLGEPKLVPISTREGINIAPDWHPNGDRVAATLSFEGNSEIYELPTGSGNPKRLTFSEAIETSPSYSPNGEQMAYVSDRTGQTQVYVMDADGGKSRRLTVINGMCDSPDWSPKGEWILFVARIDGVYDIFRVSPDGATIARLTANEGNHENPRWAPDGRHVVYSKREGESRSLYIMSANGTGKRRLTWSNGDQYNPAWSPPLYGSREY